MIGHLANTSSAGMGADFDAAKHCAFENCCFWPPQVVVKHGGVNFSDFRWCIP